METKTDTNIGNIEMGHFSEIKMSFQFVAKYYISYFQVIYSCNIPTKKRLKKGFSYLQVYYNFIKQNGLKIHFAHSILPYTIHSN